MAEASAARQGPGNCRRRNRRRQHFGVLRASGTVSRRPGRTRLKSESLGPPEMSAAAAISRGSRGRRDCQAAAGVNAPDVPETTTATTTTTTTTTAASGPCRRRCRVARRRRGGDCAAPRPPTAAAAAAAGLAGAPPPPTRPPALSPTSTSTSRRHTPATLARSRNPSDASRRPDAVPGRRRRGGATSTRTAGAPYC